MYHLTYAGQSPVVEAADLSTLTANSEGENVDILDYYAAMSALEKRLLERALNEANGSRTEAARLTGNQQAVALQQVESSRSHELTEDGYGTACK